MTLQERLNAMLEPLGGALHVDSFIQAVRYREEPTEAPPDPEDLLRRDDPAEAGEQALPPGDTAQPEPVEGDEVQAFMSRHDLSSTDDDEIREFMKERRGFDPTEIE